MNRKGLAMTPMLNGSIGLYQGHTEKRREPSETFVYIISSENSFKIGKSNDPLSRIKDLQVASPVLLKITKTIKVTTQKDAFTLEKKLHNKFSSYRLKGEWFNIVCLVECLEYVELLQARWDEMTGDENE